jgi:tRNA-Thr(GGU) m(6)t(6)A37 methyltransferase TsaA
MKTSCSLILLICIALALADERGDEGQQFMRSQSATSPFQVLPIGYVDKQDEGKTSIRLESRHQDGLLGLEQWSHVWVLYWFDRNDTAEKRAVLQVHPRGNPDNPLTGVFATRSPVRPNLIALSLCRVISINGCVIEIESIDAFDQTPVIDIKPYIRRLDMPQGHVSAPVWAEP